MTAPHACILSLFAIGAGIVSSAQAGDVADSPPTAGTPSELNDATVKRITKGYTRAKRSDTDYYCRIETAIGTRLGGKTCYTLDQLWAMELARHEDRHKTEQMQKQRTTDGN